MRFVELRGTARERGRQHGEALRDIIREIAFPRLVGSRLTDPERGERVASGFEKSISAVYPEGIEEMKGIAEGAGMPYSDILKLNLYWVIAVAEIHCSYVGFVGKDGKAVLGKNNDGGPRELITMFKAHLPSGVSYLMMVYAGVISASAGNGVNSMGLGLVGTSIGFVRTQITTKNIPQYLLCKIILERCHSVAECRKLIEATPYSGGTHVAFGDTDGNAMGAEMIPECRDMFYYPKDGVIFRTNHPVLPECAQRIDDNSCGAPLLANSRRRMKTLEALIPRTSHDVAGLQSILRSHYPQAYICQHNCVNGAIMDTDGSMIVMPAERRMLALVGAACQNDYEEFSL